MTKFEEICPLGAVEGLIGLAEVGHNGLLSIPPLCLNLTLVLLGLGELCFLTTLTGNG